MTLGKALYNGDAGKSSFVDMGGRCRVSGSSCVDGCSLAWYCVQHKDHYENCRERKKREGGESS